MNVHIIRTPESQGRPEKYIVDQVDEALDELMPPEATLFNHDPNDPEELGDPENGSAFYSVEPSISMMEQAARACRMMADGDVVFIADAQAPIAPVIRYLTRLMRINVRLTGLFHSSSITPGDMFYGDGHAEDTEVLTLKCLDTALAATDYLGAHLETLRKSSVHDADIQVTRGLPVEHVFDYSMHMRPWGERVRTCVWPHRIADDKGLEFMLELARRGIPITVLSPTLVEPMLADRLFTAGCSIYHCPTKDDYFCELGKAKVVLSTAVLETFGYAMVEGTLMGCTPVVPDRACYSEQYAVRSKYPHDDIERAMSVIQDALENHHPYHTGLRATQDFRGVAKRMAQAILG